MKTEVVGIEEVTEVAAVKWEVVAGSSTESQIMQEAINC